MSYCVNCGTEMSEQHKYCPNCGTASVVSSNQDVTVDTCVSAISNNSVNVFTTDTKSIRRNELSEMDKLINYFSIKQNVYDEYDLVSDMICRLAGGTSKAPLVWGIIVMAIGLLFSCICLGLVISLGIDYFDFASFVADFFFVLLFMGGGSALIGLFLSLKKKRKKQLIDYTDRYYRLSDELYKYYCGYEECPIGPEYTNPKNLLVVKRTIISGRANTITDALNVLVEDAFRADMKNIALLTAQYAQQSAQYAQQSAENTNSIRKTSVVSAVFAVANYFR